MAFFTRANSNVLSFLNHCYRCYRNKFTSRLMSSDSHSSNSSTFSEYNKTTLVTKKSYKRWEMDGSKLNLVECEEDISTKSWYGDTPPNDTSTNETPASKKISAKIEEKFKDFGKWND